MTKQYNHLRMMRAESFRHMRRDRLDVRMTSHSFINPYLIHLLFLPKAMHELDLDQIANIFIKLAPTSRLGEESAAKAMVLQKEIDIKEIIKQPTFRYEGISEDISQTDRAYIA